ncbi:hypothetical protein FNV43_RR06880 [Rhamnella rubrinervis]|uniref:F-box domain-containing protein n=1 Tax=Rhamnella rubrinervis TaxID=2594499 RepID=A0A8K0HE81_9ROSA|nr:hypothetical protein FNV43_RR06880 [Rhamnella rubrinervis]
MDLISELPEAILHHIINFLPTKDVARISCLSKTWRGISSSYATVNLIQSFFNHPNVFRDFMNNSLQSRLTQQQLGVQRLKFYINSDDPELYDLIDRWIMFVTGSRRLEEVRIRIQSTSWYYLPAEILRASNTLTTLSLYQCELGNLATAATNINLPHLQNLVLWCIDVDDTLVHNLILGCPLLVNLAIKDCERLTRLEVSNLQILKRIEVVFCLKLTRLKVISPSIETFIFNGWSMRRCMPCEIDLEACDTALKSLFLAYTRLPREWLQNQITKFVALESLRLCRIETLEALKISSPKLNRLYISSCTDLGATTEIDAPHLHELEYVYNKLPFYSVSTSKLKKATFRFQPGDHFTVFKEFLKRTSHLQDMKVAVLWDERRIITHELELNDSVVALKDCDFIISTMNSADWFTYLFSNWFSYLFSKNTRLDWEKMYVAAYDSSSGFLKAFHEKVSKMKMEARKALYNNGLDTDCQGLYLDDVEIGSINWAEEKEKRVNRKWIKLLKEYEKLYNITSVDFKWVRRPGCNGCRCHICLHCREIGNFNGEFG